MGRSRSRSPRRKERRRSRSKDRGDRGGDHGGIDKYGRDVRDSGRSEKRPTREETRSSREQTRSKDYFPFETKSKNTGYYANSRDYNSKDYYTSSNSIYEPTYTEVDTRYENYQQPPPPPLPATSSFPYDSRGSYYDNYNNVQKPPPKPKETEEDNEMKRLQQLMGFGGFESSKGKHKEGNSGAVAKINKPRKFRQYMNRRGGFNRPLDWVA